MGVVGIIQARLGSSRLPGKVMMPISGKPLLGHMLDQLQHCTKLDRLVVATPDQEIADYCETDVFLGDEHDVLGRYYKAAKAFEATTVVRMTADCPLIDPEMVDRLVSLFKEGSWDYLSNTRERSFARGMDVEVFSFKALEQAHREALAPEEREHVTLYLYRHPEKFSIGSFEQRLTVDTEEDFERMRALIEKCEKPVKWRDLINHGFCCR